MTTPLEEARERLTALIEYVRRYGYFPSSTAERMAFISAAEAILSDHSRAIAAEGRMREALTEAEPFLRSGDVDSRGGKIELSRLATKFRASLLPGEPK